MDYTPENFPNALEYSCKHISIVKTLRAPNGLDIAANAATGIRKVFENLNQIDIEKIQKIMMSK
ncbi:hypothetical protein SDC9_196517 [bioreactor metagenome]|uniref:Uncharacterized protein n=1 Tax=bioreactor metagenome TaxID=1076179 RepID=A0A645IC90_9ZZZZ